MRKMTTSTSFPTSRRVRLWTNETPNSVGKVSKYRLAVFWKDPPRRSSAEAGFLTRERELLEADEASDE